MQIYSCMVLVIKEERNNGQCFHDVSAFLLIFVYLGCLLPIVNKAAGSYPHGVSHEPTKDPFEKYWTVGQVLLNS